MSSESTHYYVTWTKERLATDCIPHSFFTDPPGPVEHLMTEGETGPSYLAAAVLAPHGQGISLRYKSGLDWVEEGSLRLWLEDNVPRAEWRDRDNRVTRIQPEVSREPPWGISTGPRKTPKARKLRKVDLRIEQPEFRNRALRVFSHRCAITRLPVVEALEAAHIWTYAEDHDNTDGNCLLLRRDLHALFDRKLIGLAPDGKVHFATDELKAHYSEARLGAWTAGVPAPYPEAIASRWNEFQEYRQRLLDEAKKSTC